MPAPSPATGYIVGPTFDRLCFVYIPVISLALALLAWSMGNWAVQNGHPAVANAATFLLTTFLAGFVHAHLVVAFVRSNLNPQVFQAYRARFILGPIVLIAIQLASPWAAIGVSVLAVWWDVYHSGLQTFGLGRIYEAKAGNNVLVGRRLDYLFNLVLYIGPILGGVNFAEHVQNFQDFGAVGSAALSSVPLHAQGIARPLTYVAIAAVVLFSAYYIVAQRRISAAGNPAPPQKIALYTITSLTSVLAWGFLPPIYAFFVMNFFHAVQYFAIVWWSENKRIQERLHLTKFPGAGFITALLLLGFGCSYGFGLVWYTNHHSPNVNHIDGAYVAMVILNTVAILHFWYDGFMWSVRKKEVPVAEAAALKPPAP